MSKEVPSVLASSVCWSLPCLISALTQGSSGRHFLRLTCSVAPWGGREGCCKQIILACARSASATLGLPPVHGACSLPVGCLHFPGPSRSGSGTRVVLRGADSRLGLRFVPFPDPSSSGDKVLGVWECCDLSPALCSVI